MHPLFYCLPIQGTTLPNYFSRTSDKRIHFYGGKFLPMLRMINMGTHNRSGHFYSYLRSRLNNLQPCSVLVLSGQNCQAISL